MTAYLRFRDLKERGIVNSWAMLKIRVERDGFPPGTKLGPNTRAWREDKVQAWLDSRPTAIKRDLPKPTGRRGRPRKAGHQLEELRRT
jgi:predicted DNA-binding transcriptional regulator AlpA